MSFTCTLFSDKVRCFNQSKRALYGKFIISNEMIVTHKLMDCNELIVTHKLSDCNELIVTHKLLHCNELIVTHKFLDIVMRRL